MRQLMFCFVLFTVLFSPHVISANQQDDLVGHNLEKEMRSVIDKGIMKGHGGQRFGPDDPVTRAQFSAFLARALDLPPGESSFHDVDESNVLRDEIDRAFSAGLIKGYGDNTFRPEEHITREQMAALVDRALDYKRIAKSPKELSFTDSATIASDFREAVANNTSLGIINGMPAGLGQLRFGPKEKATRAQAAAFIDRFLTVVASGGQPIIPPPPPPQFQVGTLEVNGKLTILQGNYTSFTDARSKVVNQANQVVLYNEKIIWMNQGIAFSSKTNDVVIIYENEGLTTQLTYVTNGMEMKYLESNGIRVKVQIADKIGYVKLTEVTLIPTQQIKDRSHYRVDSNGELLHYIFNHVTGKFGYYIYGKAPSFMVSNTVYYSWDGIEYLNANGSSAGVAYQYFNFLPLRTKSNYTAEELNAYIEYMGTVLPAVKDSPMKNLGATFKEAEERYQINALYLFAKAIHESNYGLSQIATEKKNLFGYQAYDRDPLGSAKPFETYEESIMFVAESMNNRYLTPAASTYRSSNGGGTTHQCQNNGRTVTCGENYRGAVLGNKGHGMNMRYASDPFWGAKIAGHMYRADRYLGKKDWNSYEIGKTTSFLNVRHQPNTNLAAQFTYPGPGFYVALLEESTQADGKWFKIYSDHKDHEFAFVHGSYVQKLNPVK